MTKIGPTTRGKVIILNDSEGVDKWIIRDADRMAKFAVDSKGYQYARKGVKPMPSGL